MRLLVSSLLLLAPGCTADDAMEAEDGPGDSSMTSNATGDGGDLGCALEGEQMEIDTTDGAPGDLQQTWGAACATNDDCVALLGEGAECLFLAVAYELPGGYCAKPCTLPGSETIVQDDPNCDPGGGVDCIGSSSVGFSYCAAVCTDDSQCSRDGYTCRLMPQISAEGDDNFCLMPLCCLDEC
jgi:hypothetical protein